MNLSDEEIANGVLATKINAYLAGYQDDFNELNSLAIEYNLSESVIQIVKDIANNGGDPRSCH